MNKTDRSRRAVQIVADGFRQGVFRNGVVVTYEAGQATTRIFPDAQAPDRLFDVASMTKVLVTWPLTVHAIEQGKLSILQTVGSLLGADVPGAWVTLAHLLTHTSGFRQETRLDKYASLEDLPNRIVGEPLDYVPGSRVRYGNGGFVLLGEILRTVQNRSLKLQFDDVVRSSMGLSALSGFSPAVDSSMFVPTLRHYNDEVMLGIPHDRNAELLGGAAGHSGCFFTGPDVLSFCRAMVERRVGNGLGRRAGIERLSGVPWYPEGEHYRGLAWRVALSPEHRLIFHHGFTGCSTLLTWRLTWRLAF